MKANRLCTAFALVLVACPSAAGAFETTPDEEVVTYILFGLERHAPAPPGLVTFSEGAKPLTTVIAMVEGARRAEIARITIERAGACSFTAELADTGSLSIFRAGKFSFDFSALENVEPGKAEAASETILTGAKMRCLASQFEGTCERFNREDAPRGLWRWRIGPIAKDKAESLQADRTRLKEAVAHLKGKVCAR